ncbi:mRNA (guanine-N(7))-methyltransferase domain [Trinorchestia longiramus]|nr:mRNA (guanine-N(7))-methyltransferase domain [Trinorchestia longiramus]
MASGYRREPLEFYGGREGRGRRRLSHGAPSSFGCFPGREIHRALDSEVRYRGGINMEREYLSWRQNSFNSRGGDRWRGRNGGGFWPAHEWRSREELASLHRRRPNYYPSCNFTLQRSCFKMSPRYEHNKWSEDETITFQGSVSHEESSGDDINARRTSYPLSRKKSPIYPLRTFNNWAKVKMIQEAIPDSVEKSMTVMDLGCCKGVDLKKWAHSKVCHVYLVEEDQEDMEECQKRFIEINNRWPDRFKATFINKDFVFDAIMLPELVDVVSCQFFVQRAFGAQEQAQTLAKNVSDALKTGGHFICSLVNADKIKVFLDRIDHKTRCSNGVFSVELESPVSDESTEFGVKMLFRVDDKIFPENLVRLNTLVRVMKKVDLELVWRRSFSELYEEARNDEEQKKLLIMMGVEEKGKLLMTRSQMETADLYEALMFRKMRPKKEIGMESATSESQKTEQTREEIVQVNLNCDKNKPRSASETGFENECVGETARTAPYVNRCGDLNENDEEACDVQVTKNQNEDEAKTMEDLTMNDFKDIKLKNLIEVMDCEEIDALLEEME